MEGGRLIDEVTTPRSSRLSHENHCALAVSRNPTVMKDALTWTTGHSRARRRSSILNVRELYTKPRFIDLHVIVMTPSNSINLRAQMHHCLTITELLSVIFQNLFSNDDTSIPLKTLANLSISCRAFTGQFVQNFHKVRNSPKLYKPEPALNALWETQRVLTPLIRCMPEDLWVHEQDSQLVSLMSQQVG
jgi:hypothetical protein